MSLATLNGTDLQIQPLCPFNQDRLGFREHISDILDENNTHNSHESKTRLQAASII